MWQVVPFLPEKALSTLESKKVFYILTFHWIQQALMSTVLAQAKSWSHEMDNKRIHGVNERNTSFLVNMGTTALEATVWNVHLVLEMESREEKGGK